MILVVLRNVDHHRQPVKLLQMRSESFGDETILDVLEKAFMSGGTIEAMYYDKEGNPCEHAWELNIRRSGGEGNP